MSSIRSSSPKAPVTDPGWRSSTLLLCAHGIRGSAGVAEAHAAALETLGCFAEVRACCLRGQPSLEQALDSIATDTVYLAPLLMAEGHTSDSLNRRIRYSDAARTCSIRLCRPVGCHPGLADLIAERAESLCKAAKRSPSETGLLLVGHGTPRHGRSSRTLHHHAARIAESRGFAEVRCAFLDDAPYIPDSLGEMTARHRVAVGFFADAGPHGIDDVARILAEQGKDNDYAGPVGGDPGLIDLVLDQLRRADVATLAA